MVLFVLGIFMGLLLDRVWWESGFNKYEKGVEFMEHYHWGLLSILIAFFLPMIAFDFMVGLGLSMILAEWAQTGYWKNGNWRRGHPFAYGSSHFVLSTLIGAVLLASVIAVWLYVIFR
ncbi:MAG: hypothetical protein NZ957_05740 [Thaumarchaeota archaeon]|nr:hypothetical protein [Candidatus Calditenuaceae archaeon]